MSLRRRTLLTSLPALACWPCAAWAQQPTAVTPPVPLPQARLEGQAKMRFFGFEVYDAYLWVQQGFESARFDQHPFALELAYLRKLDGPAIADRSLTEMQRVGGFTETQGQTWLQAMRALFPNVQRGDRLTGLHQPGEPARFWFNGRPLGEIGDAQFARLFFGIWLSPATSEPRLREALIGGADKGLR